jgi:hypothetical protein
MLSFFDAARLNDVAALEGALAQGTLATATDENGWTALHHAATGGAVDAARWLLDHGVDANAADRFGSTPLSRAVFEQQRAVTELLRARGADPTLGAAQFARRTNSPLADLFADLPEDLPEPPDLTAKVLKKGRIPGPIAPRWQDEEQRLWGLLVPPSGAAPTVQGEVIRAAGRLASEAYRNGNINWGKMYEDFCIFLADTLADYSVFSEEEVGAIQKITRELRKNHAKPDVRPKGSIYAQLSEFAVRYCTAKPDLELVE